MTDAQPSQHSPREEAVFFLRTMNPALLDFNSKVSLEDLSPATALEALPEAVHELVLAINSQEWPDLTSIGTNGETPDRALIRQTLSAFTRSLLRLSIALGGRDPRYARSSLEKRLRAEIAERHRVKLHRRMGEHLAQKVANQLPEDFAAQSVEEHSRRFPRQLGMPGLGVLDLLKKIEPKALLPSSLTSLESLVSEDSVAQQDEEPIIGSRSALRAITENWDRIRRSLAIIERRAKTSATHAVQIARGHLQFTTSTKLLATVTLDPSHRNRVTVELAGIERVVNLTHSAYTFLHSLGTQGVAVALRLPRFDGHPDYAAPTAAKQRSSNSTGLTRPTVECRLSWL